MTRGHSVLWRAKVLPTLPRKDWGLPWTEGPVHLLDQTEGPESLNIGHLSKSPSSVGLWRIQFEPAHVSLSRWQPFFERVKAWVNFPNHPTLFLVPGGAVVTLSHGITHHPWPTMIHTLNIGRSPKDIAGNCYIYPYLGVSPTQGTETAKQNNTTV